MESSGWRVFRCGEKVVYFAIGKAYLHNTYPSSLAGLPSISVPCGFIGNLPFGIEFVAMEGEDDLLLQVAKMYEEIRGEFPEPKFE